jgi:hypothetical protein
MEIRKNMKRLARLALVAGVVACGLFAKISCEAMEEGISSVVANTDGSISFRCDFPGPAIKETWYTLQVEFPQNIETPSQESIFGEQLKFRLEDSELLSETVGQILKADNAPGLALHEKINISANLVELMKNCGGLFRVLVTISHDVPASWRGPASVGYDVIKCLVFGADAVIIDQY